MLQNSWKTKKDWSDKFSAFYDYSLYLSNNWAFGLGFQIFCKISNFDVGVQVFVCMFLKLFKLALRKFSSIFRHNIYLSTTDLKFIKKSHLFDLSCSLTNCFRNVWNKCEPTIFNNRSRLTSRTQASTIECVKLCGIFASFALGGHSYITLALFYQPQHFHEFFEHFFPSWCTKNFKLQHENFVKM